MNEVILIDYDNIAKAQENDKELEKLSARTQTSLKPWPPALKSRFQNKIRLEV